MRVALTAVAIATTLAGGRPATAADLSPGRWPAEVRAALETRDYYALPAYPAAVKGRAVLVTGTSSPVAIHAGVEALRQGGSAADAAATVALTQVSSELGSDVSYAGILKLIYFEAKTGKVHSLEAGWGTYAGETDPASIPLTDLSYVTGVAAPEGTGSGALGRQTLVPGFMAGIEAMHGRFGRLPFADLFQPSIWYAENGITVSPVRAYFFQSRQAQLWRTAAGRRFASMPDGALPRMGDLYRQPDLARTLRAVAAQGARYMYTGDWAKAFVDAVNAEGGKATLADLAAYKVHWDEPLSVNFADSVVYAPGGGSDASCPVLVALNLLSGARVDRLGPYWRDPKSFVAHLDALRFAQYAVKAPAVEAWERSKGFSPDCRSRLTPEYGAAIGPQVQTLLTPPPAPSPGANHTESVVVVDRWGNVAVLVHTINCVVWGDTGIVVGGVPLADSAAIYRDRMNNLKPGEHVPNEVSPIVALRNSKPVLAIAGTGSGSVAETATLAAGVLAQGLDLRTLRAAPPLLANADWTAGALWDWREMVPPGAYDAGMRRAIEALGVRLQEDATRPQVIRGWSAAVVIDQPSGAPSTVELSNLLGFAEADRPSDVAAPKAVTVPMRVVDSYVGDYDVGANFHIHVYREGRRLFAKATDRPVVELFAASEATFFEKVENLQVTYEREGGKPTGKATMRLPDGREVVATRRQAVPKASTPPPP